ncbi:HAD hydrolase family protein, partial [bacterium LRH843]|nr:HAD hydrolase family protein [bacterium LRH843]
MKEGTGVPHIVFSDLDGSFLTTDKAVHPLNETALTRLAELHIPFVACSGRPRGGLAELAQRLGCSYLVASNGADISCCDT